MYNQTTNLEVIVKKHKLWFIVVLVSAMLIPITQTVNSVHAEASTTKNTPWLQISPTQKSITLDPGEIYRGEMTVSNIGSGSFDFKVYASPFNVVGDSYNDDYQSVTKYNQIHRWVTFEQKEYSLGSKEERVVKYRIEVPKDVSAGGQYAMIFAESGGGSSNSSGIKAISRVGMRLIARIKGETRENAEIVDYRTPKLYISFGRPKINASAKVKNTGNTDFEARYLFQIKTFFGDEEVYSNRNSQGAIETHLIYPESEYQHAVSWEGTPLLGLFKVTYTVSAKGEIRGDGAYLVLVMPAWLLGIIIILLTVLIIWIILKVKKRRQLRSKIRF